MINQDNYITMKGQKARYSSTNMNLNIQQTKYTKSTIRKHTIIRPELSLIPTIT